MLAGCSKLEKYMVCVKEIQEDKVMTTSQEAFDKETVPLIEPQAKGLFATVTQRVSTARRKLGREGRQVVKD